MGSATFPAPSGTWATKAHGKYKQPARSCISCDFYVFLDRCFVISYREVNAEWILSVHSYIAHSGDAGYTDRVPERLVCVETEPGSQPLRTSYHLAAFSSRFHRKQVHFR